jgi:cob(I)alamin adenosyltransferase
MKIYTRTGDKGDTGLLGGTRVPKDHLRIEAYGTIDELNSHIGMLRDLGAFDQSELLLAVQDRLFSHRIQTGLRQRSRGRSVQGAPSGRSGYHRVGSAMDAMDKELPEMRNFILPGGHPAVSQAHICRTVCRRAERNLVNIDAARGTSGDPGALPEPPERPALRAGPMARKTHRGRRDPLAPPRPDPQTLAALGPAAFRQWLKSRGCRDRCPSIFAAL